MSGLSKIYNEKAQNFLAQWDQEYSTIAKELYGDGVSETPKTSQQKAKRQRLEDIAREYRGIFYQQFAHVTNFETYLQNAAQIKQRSELRNDVIREARLLQKQMLPFPNKVNVHTHENTNAFSGNGGKIHFTAQDIINSSELPVAESLVIIEEPRPLTTTNICLIHIPGSILGTPTNFAREILTEIKSDLSKFYDPDYMQFYNYIPQECNQSGKEDFTRLTERPTSSARGSVNGVWFSPLQILPKMIAEYFNQYVSDPFNSNPMTISKFAVHTRAYREFQLSF